MVKCCFMISLIFQPFVGMVIPIPSMKVRASPAKTNKAPENGDGWKTSFLLPSL